MTTIINDNTFTKTIDSDMSDREFQRLSEFIYSECGIKMPPAKKIMLSSRLQKRVRKLQMSSISEYCNYLFSPQGIENEVIHMIDVVTTNKTDFFREPKHFNYLVQKALPGLLSGEVYEIGNKLMVWSAGCSTGEEPYTLAIVLKEFAAAYPEYRLDFLILATDISTRVLQKAKLAVYVDKIVEPIPDELKSKYLLKGKDKKKGLVRMAPEVRDSVKFRRLNFIDSDFGMREQLDIIFCRNVIIYFDRATQEKLLNRFCSHLNPGGYIFLGHSESLNGLNVNLIQVAPTVYRKPA